MKRKLLLIVAAAIALMLAAACTSSTGYPSPSASPSTPAPSITTPAPTPSTPTATNNPSSPTAAVTLNITAQNFAFDTKSLAVRMGSKVTIVFNNKDSAPHNVAIYTDSSATNVIFRGDIITGTKTITYTFDAPAPGNYFFRCDVHPSQMTGTFTVSQ